jgi:hypothetical protein
MPNVNVIREGRGVKSKSLTISITNPGTESFCRFSQKFDLSGVTSKRFVLKVIINLDSKLIPFTIL